MLPDWKGVAFVRPVRSPKTLPFRPPAEPIVIAVEIGDKAVDIKLIPLSVEDAKRRYPRAEAAYFQGPPGWTVKIAPKRELIPTARIAR
jgi:hypothetical protein